jgi:hypothetical protein
MAKTKQEKIIEKFYELTKNAVHTENNGNYYGYKHYSIIENKEIVTNWKHILTDYKTYLFVNGKKMEFED